jgi:urease accessory protein
VTGFIDGVAQFFTPTHLLAVVTLGLLIGQQGSRARGIVLAIFALGVTVGAIAIAAAVGETPAAMVLLAIAVFAEIMVTLARPTAPFISYAMSFATGAALGLNSPPQAIAISSAIAAQFATCVAAIGTLAAVMLIAVKAERPWERIGIRILGSWIAASAILVLALRLRR